MLCICSLFLKYRKLSRIFLENFQKSILTISVPLTIIENICFYPTLINFILFRKMAYQLEFPIDISHISLVTSLLFSEFDDFSMSSVVLNYTIIHICSFLISNLNYNTSIIKAFNYCIHTTRWRLQYIGGAGVLHATLWPQNCCMLTGPRGILIHSKTRAVNVCEIEILPRRARCASAIITPPSRLHTADVITVVAVTCKFSFFFSSKTSLGALCTLFPE